jgi:hypothetical protein
MCCNLLTRRQQAFQLNKPVLALACWECWLYRSESKDFKGVFTLNFKRTSCTFVVRNATWDFCRATWDSTAEHYKALRVILEFTPSKMGQFTYLEFFKTLPLINYSWSSKTHCENFYKSMFLLDLLVSISIARIFSSARQPIQHMPFRAITLNLEE